MKESSRLSTEELRQIAEQGYVVVSADLDAQALCELGSVLNTKNPGGRNLLEIPIIRRTARSDALRDLAEAVLGSDCFAVRGILFNKTYGTNWKVTRHQDCVIAVAERNEIPGGGRGRSKLASTMCVPVLRLFRECWRFASIWMSAEPTTALCE